MYGVMTEEEQYAELLLKNTANYGPYKDLVTGDGTMCINCRNINDINIDDHLNWIYNILLDGINLERVQGYMLYVSFLDMANVPIPYTIEDYFIQLIFWKLPVSIGAPLTSETMFHHAAITTDTIARYINREYVKKFIANIKQNNIQMNTELLMTMNLNINECLERFKMFIEFQMYLCNTLCLEDTLDMMNKYPEFYDSMHLKLSGVPLSDVQKLGMDAAKLQVEYITREDSDHCLKTFFQSGECLSIKQYKEVQAHVGVKPNGEGGIIPAMIDKSYINGGLETVEAHAVDASASRVAQMLSHENVGRSGDFARILELNCQDTKLYPDSRYKCDTKHTITRHIDSQKTLDLYDGRYYRFKKIFEDNQNEPDRVIDAEQDTWLIGRTIELYSPMTCASRSRGEGVCYRCYGDLAYTNFNINIGVIATELVSSKYTQRQLSAKHILEARVKELLWNNPVEDIFEISFNTIKCYDTDEYEEMYNRMNLIINTGDFDFEDKNDDLEYNAFVVGFKIEKDGVITEYNTQNNDCIYLSADLNEIIADKLSHFKSYDGEDVDVSIPVSELIDCDELFLFHINNDELSKAVNAAKTILNKGTVTETFTKDSILEEFCNVNLQAGFNVKSIHYEIIIANQMKDANDNLEYPDWTMRNVDYKIVALSKSLIENPCVTTSLQYQKIAQQIWKPITYIKKKPAMNDMYFMIQPQQYIHSAGLIADSTNIVSDSEENIVEAVSFNKDLIGRGDFHGKK